MNSVRECMIEEPLQNGDWPEDFSHENGNYNCICCYCNEIFVGHKRRVVCKECAADRTEVRASLVVMVIGWIVGLSLLLWPLFVHAGVREQLWVADAESRAQAANRRDLPNDFDKGQDQVGVVATAPAPIEMTVYTMDGCVPCAQMLRQVGNGNDRVKLTWTKDQPPAGIPALRPVTVWTSPQGVVTYRVGVSSLADLIRCYESDLSKAAGAAPLRIRSRIVDAIGKFRQYAGESASIRLDRSGETRFALLEANTKYDLATVMGAYGRVEISCPKTPLVVNKLGCRYSVDGDDLTLDLDPIALRGFGAKLHPTSAVGADPVGVDPGTILTVVTILHGLWQLAHPSCDLELPGSLTCDVTLVGDVMTIKLNGPRIRITAYWQWLLGVDTVIVSPDKIRVEFVNQPGTMWPIRSREWAVTE